MTTSSKPTVIPNLIGSNPTAPQMVAIDAITQAAQCLQLGKLLAYPTESVWGIGCDPFDECAVRQLLTIKQRDIAKGLIVITDSADRIGPLLESLTEQQRHTILSSWQPVSTLHPSQPHDVHAQKSKMQKPQAQKSQAQTWLLPLTSAFNAQLPIPIPAWITGAHESVAVRVIAHPLIKQLCAQLVSPHNPYGFIVSTSCNPSGQAPALSLAQAQDYFQQSEQQVCYLQGDTLGFELPSQIHDALTGNILR